MIVNMKFLTVTGPRDDIDRVTAKYLSRYEIQLENALSELKDVQKLRPYTSTNPYKEPYNRVLNYGKYIDLDSDDSITEDLDYDAIIKMLDDADKKYQEIEAQNNNLTEKLQALSERANTIYPFRNLEYNINSILDFKFIRFSFGRLPQSQYEKFVKFMYDELDVVFVKCMEKDGFVWGVYFAPKTKAPMMEAIFSSLHFEKTFIPHEYNGTPYDAYNYLQTQIAEIKKHSDRLSQGFTEYLNGIKAELSQAKRQLARLSNNFDIRKLAAITSHEHTNRDYFILCGWIAAKDADRLEAEIENEPNVYCYVEDPQNNESTISTPPTRLKNPKIIKPFEMYIKMYGLPAYNEMDPTLFVALTYSFIFGAMFGDVGQGICLAIGGFLLYKLKNMNLAAIISCAGVFSTFFGFMYGSIFGFEDIIEARWLHPAEQMMTLPFIGKMNTVFVVAIAFGMFMILFTMILQIVNAIRQKNIEGIFFDTNGIAGFVFYASLVLMIFLYMGGKTLPATILLVVMFGIPLLLIALKEPLTNLVKKHQKLIEGTTGMFIVQTFFEMFEVLLSYFSNTLSFVRVGAFAISHAAMMEVVLMLAGAESGSPNMLVIVLGNLFVCGMEGLIVGIQVLRLEYYEMFSRFYKGTGREFVPYKVSK
ncbi:MAG: V-type ATPase 116kDa subunit family protein [Thermoflexaceae bacterium]|nr:V-type ATPase 116kDa subunit family protein [Thermoflexaceae bacterium]